MFYSQVLTFHITAVETLSDEPRPDACCNIFQKYPWFPPDILQDELHKNRINQLLHAFYSLQLLQENLTFAVYVSRGNWRCIKFLFNWGTEFLQNLYARSKGNSSRHIIICAPRSHGDHFYWCTSRLWRKFSNHKWCLWKHYQGCKPLARGNKLPTLIQLNGLLTTIFVLVLKVVTFTACLRKGGTNASRGIALTNFTYPAT